MKKLFLFISALLCVAYAAKAQQTLSSKEMIGITPMVSNYVELPADAQKSLGIKLSQMATQNGFGSNSADFILTANVVMLDKQATATAPVKFITELEVSVYVLNVVEQIAIDEMSFVVKGIGDFENKAVIQAINQIKPKSTAARTFMDGVRTKIVQYYNTRIPALMAKAQSLADRAEYDEALWVLSSIPESVDQYQMVAEQMTAIYIQMLNRDAKMALQDAKGFIAIRDYGSALNALMWVDPSSSHYNDALALIAQIKAAVDENERRELEEKLRAYEDSREDAQRSHDLATQAIDAAKTVGAEKAKTETSVMKKLNDWFLGKFK